MTKARRLTKEKIQEQVDEAWRQMLETIGLKWSPAEVRRMLKDLKVAPDVRVARGLTIGMALGLGGMGKTVARETKTEAQLAKVLQEIKRMSELMPTTIRKATKEMLRTLPRRGGPGRRPKLSAAESAQVCDQIAVFIRQKHNVKEALQRVAELTPTLLGKRVGTRTLQKAWDRRGEFSSE